MQTCTPPGPVFGWGEEFKTLSGFPCPSCMSVPIHPKHCTDFLISPARDVREQHPWEARRRHEGCSLPGLSASGARTIGAACTNSKPYGLTQSQDLWLPTMMLMATAATALLAPPPSPSSAWQKQLWKPVAIFHWNCWLIPETRIEIGVR